MKRGNATEAAFHLYNVKNRKSAAVIGSRLLRNVNVIREIERVYEAEESIPTLMVKLLKETLEHGTGKEHVQAIKIAMRLHGYY